MSWTPPADATGSVMLQLFDPAGLFVDCTAADSSGTITVPAAAMASFISGDNGYATLSRSAIQSIPGLGCQRHARRRGHGPRPRHVSVKTNP